MTVTSVFSSMTSRLPSTRLFLLEGREGSEDGSAASSSTDSLLRFLWLDDSCVGAGGAGASACGVGGADKGAA